MSKKTQEQSQRLRVANRNAQIALAAGIALCAAFAWREMRHIPSDHRPLIARSTPGLPGPFVHGLIPGRTRLIQAILSKKSALALSLIRTGDPQQVNAVDALGWSPLIAAAYRGDTAVAAALLAANASVGNSTRNGKTALLYASQEGYGKITAVLLAHGADANEEDEGGATPLMWAALRDDGATCAALLAAGADVNRVDKHGYTALNVAALSDSGDVLKLLLAHGADPALTARRDIDQPLANALSSGDAAESDALINAGASVNATTRDGFTPLMLAVQNDLPQPTIDLLIAHGANVQQATSDGTTALCYECASPHGTLPLALDLLQHGASATNGSTDQTTPLMYASEAGHADIVRVLLAHGADPQTVTNRGMTALHWATGEGYAALVGTLLRAGGETE